jgi:hypothetical protein
MTSNPSLCIAPKASVLPSTQTGWRSKSREFDKLKFVTHARQLLMLIMLVVCVGWLAAWLLVALCLMPIVMIARRGRHAYKVGSNRIGVESKHLKVSGVSGSLSVG